MKPVFAFTQLGTTARACLAPGQRGKVLASFSKAIYLLTEANELFWITTDDAPMHRRCVTICTPLPRPLAGAPFRVEDHHLTIDPGFIFETENMSLWTAPRVDPSQVLEITGLPARIDALFSNLDLSQIKGFGRFIPHILSLLQDESINPASDVTDLILRSAQPFVLDMTRACLEHDPSRVAHYAHNLFGLGTGLTPSGDDFLGGLLFCINALQTAYPELNFFKPIPLEAYRVQTHPISFVLLHDLANGHAIAPLHHIVNGLLSAQSLESIDPFVSQLTQVGHSTGWDLLTGLLTGLLLAYQGNYFIPSSQLIQGVEA
jgi:hypothetical protein